MPEKNARLLAELLTEHARPRGKSLGKLAQKAGLSHQYVYDLGKGVNPKTGYYIEPTVETLRKLSDALDIPFVDLMIRIGYLEESDQERIIPLDKEYFKIAKWAEGESIPPAALKDALELFIKLRKQ